MVVKLQNHKNTVFAIPLSFSIKESNEMKSLSAFIKKKSHIEPYRHVGPVVVLQKYKLSKKAFST